MRNTSKRKQSVVTGIYLASQQKTPRISDRKSTRLNSSHLVISYAVFCLKKKKKDSIIFCIKKCKRFSICPQYFYTVSRVPYLSDCSVLDAMWDLCIDDDWRGSTVRQYL